MKRIHIFWGCITASILLLNACSSSRQIQRMDTHKSTEAVYATRILQREINEQAITAKLEVTISMGNKQINASGNLRMYHNDVIQLSVSFLGMEMGRMEFTPQEVLIVDRFNKEYVKIPYSQISLFQAAHLDFNALQALFWNQIFLPGMQKAADGINRFRLSESGAYTQLNLSDTPQLTYAFLTLTTSALLTQTTIRSKQITDPTYLTVRYADFTPMALSSFPKNISFMLHTSKAKEYALSLSLSRLNHNIDWARRTTLSSKYKQRTLQEVMGKIMSLQ